MNKWEGGVTVGWDELSALVGERPFNISRIRIPESGIAIEGEFEVPPLARLSFDDQVFVAMFIRAHGSIKQVEKDFGVSYPTIKSRLNRIADQLSFVDIEVSAPREEVLEQLESGAITAQEAVERIKTR